jgi:hypothetical protein
LAGFLAFLLSEHSTVLGGISCLPTFLTQYPTRRDFLPSYFPELKSRDDIPYCWEVKISFKLVWMNLPPINAPDWPLVEVALLLIGLIHIFLTNTVLTLWEEISPLLDCQLFFLGGGRGTNNGALS